MFIRVDFPAPEGPMMAVRRPDLNLPDTHFRMVLYPDEGIDLIRLILVFLLPTWKSEHGLPVVFYTHPKIVAPKIPRNSKFKIV